MATKIKIRRGLEADLPALDVGELGFTTDTHKLYVGTATGNVLVQGGGGGGLVLPYGNIEQSGGITIPPLEQKVNYFVTDPISDELKQMIIDEEISIQLWMYRMALRSNRGSSGIARKFTHAEDLTGTPSLLTGHIRPANLGDGVKMVSLQLPNPTGNSIPFGNPDDINPSDITFVTNNAAHYNGYVKTEVVVTAAMIQADNRIRIPMKDIATSWLANNVLIGVSDGGNPIGYDWYVKKSTLSAHLVHFDMGNIPTPPSTRTSYLWIRGMSMAGMSSNAGVTYGGATNKFYGTLLTGPKTFSFGATNNLSYPPFASTRALQFRLVATTNGTDLIYGPPTSARGVFRLFNRQVSVTPQVNTVEMSLYFVNDTRKNLVPGNVLSNILGSL